MINLFKIEKKDEIYYITISNQYQVAVFRDVIDKIETLFNNLKYSIYNNKQYYSFVSLGYSKTMYSVTLECSNIQISKEEFESCIQFRFTRVIHSPGDVNSMVIPKYRIDIDTLDNILNNLTSIKED